VVALQAYWFSGTVMTPAATRRKRATQVLQVRGECGQRRELRVGSVIQSKFGRVGEHRLRIKGCRLSISATRVRAAISGLVGVLLGAVGAISSTIFIRVERSDGRQQQC